jgi:hypothetical protein
LGRGPATPCAARLAALREWPGSELRRAPGQDCRLSRGQPLRAASVEQSALPTATGIPPRPALCSSPGTAVRIPRSTACAIPPGAKVSGAARAPVCIPTGASLPAETGAPVLVPPGLPSGPALPAAPGTPVLVPPGLSSRIPPGAAVSGARAVSAASRTASTAPLGLQTGMRATISRPALRAGRHVPPGQIESRRPR